MPSHMHMPSVKNCHGRSIHDPFSKTKSFCFIFLLDSLRDIVWIVSNQYFGQPLRSAVDNLRYVLWSVSEKYCGRSSKIICILDVSSNPKHRVDHFHALTSMSRDALCINAMQVSLHVISCYMYATCHMQHISHTLHVKCHGKIMFNAYNYFHSYPTYIT